jgi:hypothetical protein
MLGKRNSHTLLVGMQASTTTMENIMEVPKKTNHRSAIRTTNTTPRDIPEGMRLKLLQKHLHTHVYCSIIYNSQAMETAKMSHNQQMDQENMVLLHNGVLLSHEE